MHEPTLSSEDRYRSWQEDHWREWEETCLSCGMCCGIKEGDPCEQLVFKDNGTYMCRVYANRLGPQRTIQGRKFHCVPIRDILHQSWTGDDMCAYKKKFLKAEIKSF